MYLRKLKIELVEGEFPSPVKGQVRDPKQVFEVFSKLKDRAQETLIGVFLTKNLEAASYDVLSLGSQSETVMDSADIFGRAYVLRARYVILIHNHPNGDPTPSPEDREAMRGLLAESKVMKTALLDFIIVGERGYWSMFEEMEGGEYSLGAAA